MASIGDVYREWHHDDSGSSIWIMLQKTVVDLPSGYQYRVRYWHCVVSTAAGNIGKTLSDSGYETRENKYGVRSWERVARIAVVDEEQYRDPA